MHVEQQVEIPVQMMQEQTVHVPKAGLFSNLSSGSLGLEIIVPVRIIVNLILGVAVPVIITLIRVQSRVRIIGTMIYLSQVMVQKRQTHQHVEQLVEVPVPMTQEEVVHVPEIITQTRVQQEHVEQMIEVPIPMQQEEVVHVPEIVMQPRIVHQPVEQIVEARLGILLTFSEAFVSCKIRTCCPSTSAWQE